MSTCNEMDCSGCSKKRGRDPTNEVQDNKVTKNLEDLDGTVKDEYVNQILKDLSSQVTYVTGPQDSRKYFQIHLASENQKTDQELIAILSNNLQQSDPNFIFYIAGFKSQRLENDLTIHDKIVYQCDVCTFVIAKELMAQLVASDIKKIYYFIGNWDQGDKFLVSSNRPDNSDIARTNREGMELPFETCELNLETIN
jgi:hypothetical protein